MEFSVKNFDLLQELSLTQGVGRAKDDDPIPRAHLVRRPLATR